MRFKASYKSAQASTPCPPGAAAAAAGGHSVQRRNHHQLQHPSSGSQAQALLLPLLLLPPPRLAWQLNHLESRRRCLLMTLGGPHSLRPPLPTPTLQAADTLADALCCFTPRRMRPTKLEHHRHASLLLPARPPPQHRADATGLGAWGRGAARPRGRQATGDGPCGSPSHGRAAVCVRVTQTKQAGDCWSATTMHTQLYQQCSVRLACQAGRRRRQGEAGGGRAGGRRLRRLMMFF